MSLAAEPALALPSSMRVFQRGWLSSNNVLFAGRTTALVDSGYVSHAPQTLALVRHALQGRPLDCLINTHLHSDHCGGNASLQRAYGCRTAIPAADADAVRRWDEQALSFQATGQRCAQFTFTDTLQPGDLLELGDLPWQVLAAPGHDPHALLLYCAPERILISGDALWENGFGVMFPELTGGSGFAEARATLDLIAALDVRLVIPGHGAPFADAGQALAVARSRLAYLAADPRRNARHAVHVLLKFLLLERRRIAVPEVTQLLDQIALCRQANQDFLRLTPAALAESCIAHLVKAGAAIVVDGMLCDAGT